MKRQVTKTLGYETSADITYNNMVLTRLDYGNATLAGISAALLNRLQSVLNAAARSIAGLRRSDHITVTLVSLHRLRTPERITFKLAVIV